MGFEIRILKRGKEPTLIMSLFVFWVCSYTREIDEEAGFVEERGGREPKWKVRSFESKD